MTASNIDLFPCRVKLLGLTYSSNVASSGTSSSTTVAKLHSIRRNLFGSPDPAEMKAFYQKEDEQTRSYILQRYNLDTKALLSTNDQECKQFPTDKTYSRQNTIIPMQPSQLPSVIQQEVIQHESSLNREKCRLNTPFLQSLQKKKDILVHASCAKIACKCKDSKNFLLTKYKHKQKCRRQLSLKRSFKIRKNLLCMKNSS